ncbi:hypothetical protein K402DRAFT_139750 [Aulographum hederae CBS 113979]|uniref:Uncharacterized protein n=1 Tax=Aulographum hederae CBS 113979 TaxID=1176131 RepID=A0A6G1GUE9_9PEZI|nr:hypothetical protein K402DRAFT_139750 [Aulographum hederae CBS 113979]
MTFQRLEEFSWVATTGLMVRLVAGQTFSSLHDRLESSKGLKTLSGGRPCQHLISQQPRQPVLGIRRSRACGRRSVCLHPTLLMMQMEGGQKTPTTKEIHAVALSTRRDGNR